MVGGCPFCSRDQNLVDSSPWELVMEKSLAVTHITHSCTWPEPGDARSHLSPQSGGTSKAEAHGSGALTSVLSGPAVLGGPLRRPTGLHGSGEQMRPWV